MTETLRLVEGAATGPDADEKVRMVARMLLGMHRMTEIDLGRQLGLQRTSIYNRLQGRTPFTVAEVARMGEIFNIPPEVFLVGPAAILRSGSITVRKSTAVRHLPEPNASPVRRPALSLVAA